MKTKHSPGPYSWSYSTNDPFSIYGEGEVRNAEGDLLAIISGYNYGVVFGGKDRHYNENYQQEDLDEHKANALLFSKAPDLLESLSEIMTLFPVVEDDGTGRAGFKPEVVAMLTKAKNLLKNWE